MATLNLDEKCYVKLYKENLVRENNALGPVAPLVDDEAAFSKVNVRTREGCFPRNPRSSNGFSGKSSD